MDKQTTADPIPSSITDAGSPVLAGIFAEAAATVLGACQRVSQMTDLPGQIFRQFLTNSARDCQLYVAERMRSSGMRTFVDGAGNLCGSFQSATTAKRLLLFSHLDTVPNAGAFDGVLGVVLAIALVGIVKLLNRPANIDVVGFSEEEGVRFGIPFIGSRALTGTLENGVLEARDRNGVSVRRAIADFGLNPDCLASMRLNPDVTAALEFHIEQGPILDGLGSPLGVVTGIVGQSRATVEFMGQAGHAGATPMQVRRDALAAAAEWIVHVENVAKRTKGLVATVGKCDVMPNASNVIADYATLSLDVRHAFDSERRSACSDLLQEAGRIAQCRNVGCNYQMLVDQPASPMDPELTRILADSISASGLAARRMESGAGHDAMIIAPFVPTTMLFLRSPRGISHHPDESVLVEDIEMALRAGYEFICRLFR